jgi:hypothetical protein
VILLSFGQLGGGRCGNREQDGEDRQSSHRESTSRQNRFSSSSVMR